MKKLKLFIALTSIATTSILLTTSCENNSKEVLYGCDSVNVSYSKTIKPIIAANCNSCHSTANATAGSGGGIILDNYNSLFINNYIDTTAADGGTLLNDIKHLGNPMPQNNPKLNNCDIAKIEHWIFEGAKNN